MLISCLDTTYMYLCYRYCLQVENFETTCTQCKEDSAERRSPFLRSLSSRECKSTSTSEEVDDSTDTSYSDERLRDGREGVYLATKWQYVDLKNINFFLQ